MSRVTPGVRRAGARQQRGARTGRRKPVAGWLRLCGAGGRIGGGGEGCELDQAANYPNCRAAVAGPGCLGGHRAHICSKIIPRPAAGNRWRGHRTMARSIYPHKDDTITIRHKNTASHCGPTHCWTRIQTKLGHE